MDRYNHVPNSFYICHSHTYHKYIKIDQVGEEPLISTVLYTPIHNSNTRSKISASITSLQRKTLIITKTALIVTFVITMTNIQPPKLCICTLWDPLYTITLITSLVVCYCLLFLWMWSHRYQNTFLLFCCLPFLLLFSKKANHN